MSAPCPQCGQPDGLHLESCPWRHLTIGPNGERWPPPPSLAARIWAAVPEVRRPLNPAYHSAWEAMTRTERQVSWLVDWSLVLAVLAMFGLLL